MDKVYLPFYKQFMVGNEGIRREKFNAIVNRILSLDIEVLIPCHGDIIKGNRLIRSTLKRHFLE
jgi:hypothetical protein